MEIDLTELEPRYAHDLMTSAIIPRPIAWVSSMNEQGQVNYRKPFRPFRHDRKRLGVMHGYL
jgi:hypothetical protein